MWEFDFSKMRTIREVKHLTRKQCATAIGKTKVAYGLKENGQAPFSAAEVGALATLFKVEPKLFYLRKK